MLRRSGRLLAVLIVVGALAACSSSGGEAPPTEPAVTVVEVEGSELERLTLSSSAAARLGVETTPVRAAVRAGGRLTIPYAAVIYDADGGTWAYENVEGLTFVRHPLTVETVVDGDAILSDGPAIDALVVTVGAAELYGVEKGVGGGH